MLEFKVGDPTYGRPELYEYLKIREPELPKNIQLVLPLLRPTSPIDPPVMAPATVVPKTRCHQISHSCIFREQVLDKEVRSFPVLAVSSPMTWGRLLTCPVCNFPIRQKSIGVLCWVVI